jgi:hypothetical protein
VTTNGSTRPSSAVAAVDHAATLELLHRLGAAGNEVVVVGGQAVIYWTARYRSSNPMLAESGPSASKDIDLLGGRESVRACAAVLQGQSLYPSPNDPTPSSGKVVYVDAANERRELDFLHSLYGLDAKDDVRRHSRTVEVDRGTDIVRFRVMHPFHCLKCRVSNVAGLGYRKPHALNQLRASIVCMREFLRQELIPVSQRAVMSWNERVFELSRSSIHARDVYLDFGIEVFDAVLSDDSRLPPKFLERRYPQMEAIIDARRSRAKTRRFGDPLR